MLNVNKIALLFLWMSVSFAHCFGIESKLPNLMRRVGEPTALNGMHTPDNTHYLRKPVFDQVRYAHFLRAQQQDDYCALLIAHHTSPVLAHGFDVNLSQHVGEILNFSSPVPLSNVVQATNDKANAQTSAESSNRTRQLTFDFEVESPSECTPLGPQSNCVHIGFAVSVHSIYQFPEVFHDVIGALVAQSNIGPAHRPLQREAGIHAALLSPHQYALSSNFYHSNHPFNILDRDALPFITTFYENKFATSLSRHRLQKIGNTVYVDRFHTHIDTQIPIHSARDIIVADLEQTWLQERFPEQRIVLRSHVVPTQYNGEIIVTYTRLFHGSWY